MIAAMSLRPITAFGSHLYAQALTGAHSVFDGAAPQSLEIEHLFWFLFGLCLVVYIATVAFYTIGASITYTSGSKPLPIIQNPKADRAANWWVGSAIGLTVLILFSFLAMSIRTGALVLGANAHNAVTIQVTVANGGEFTYIDSRPDHTINTANGIPRSCRATDRDRHELRGRDSIASGRRALRGNAI